MSQKLILSRGRLSGTYVAAAMLLVAGCASVPGTDQSTQAEVDEQWRAVPESEPRVEPAPDAGDSETPLESNPARTEIADSDLPVIEPLRTPLSVSPSVAEAPSDSKSAPAEDADLPVVQLTEEASPSPETPVVAATEQSDEVVEKAADKATGEVAKAAEQAKPVVDTSTEVAKAEKSEPIKADAEEVVAAAVTAPVVKKAIDVVVDDEDAVAERQIDPEPEAEQVVAKAETKPETAPVTSDVELLCTEVISGVTIGSDACAILDGSVAGLGFVSETAELTDSAKEVLDSVADELQKKPNLRVSVATYSNDLEDTALGKLLARRRTLAVIRHIISNGVDSVRVRPNNAPTETSQDDGANPSEYLVVLRTVVQ